MTLFGEYSLPEVPHGKETVEERNLSDRRVKEEVEERNSMVLDSSIIVFLWALFCCLIGLGVSIRYLNVFTIEQANTISFVIRMMGFLVIPIALICSVVHLLRYRSLSPERLAYRHAFLTRDRRGTRVPSRRYQEAMVVPTDFKGQPPALLLTLIASKKITSGLHNECVRALGGTDRAVPLHPAATILTKVDFACSHGLPIVLSDYLWPRAVEELLRSDSPAARVAGVQYSSLPLKRLLTICRYDDADNVRQMAWCQIEALWKKMARQEISIYQDRLYLVMSPHQDVRTHALSGLSIAQTANLHRSKYPDIRCAAVATGHLPQDNLFDMVKSDPDAIVRQAAWQSIRHRNLSKGEYGQLFESRFLDIRLAVAQNETTPQEYLVKLTGDLDAEIRATVSKRALKGASLREYLWMCNHALEDVRMQLVQYNYSNPEMLNKVLQILAKDSQVDIRMIANQRLLQDCPLDNLASLANNPDIAVRFAVTQHPLAPKDLLQKLTEDRERKVRVPAYKRLFEDVTTEDLTALSKNQNVDVRTAVAGHPNTPLEVLLPLATDRSAEVRGTALPRTLPLLSERQFGTLLETQHDDVRKALAACAKTPRSILMKLVCDVNATVRQPALSQVLPSLTFFEIAKLLQDKSRHSDVVGAMHQAIRNRLGQPGADCVLPHLYDNELQMAVIESVLGLEGNSALSNIKSILGVNKTVTLTNEERLYAFIQDLSSDSIAEFLAGTIRTSKQIRIGTISEEREETTYDSYSGSSTQTYTYTEDKNITASYFEPSLISIEIRLLKALGNQESIVAVASLAKLKPDLAELLGKGLQSADWRKIIEAGVLEQAHAFTQSTFSPLPDNSITAQLV